MSVLVLSATGTTGAQTLRALLARGVTVRAASRDPQAARFPAGVTPVAFSLEDRSTWAAALRGVTSLYLALPPFREDELAVGTALVAAARDAGVSRIVKLSAIGVDAVPQSSHRQLEQVVEASGASWIHLRPTFFMENFIHFYGEPLRTQDSLFLPAGTGRTGFVAASDIGEAAAEALTSDRSGEAWTLTGGQSLDHDAVVAALSAAVGRPLRYVPISTEDFAAALAGAGMNAVGIQTMSTLYEGVRAGYFDGVTDVVAQVTGHAPVAFSDWAQQHAPAWAR